MKKLIGLIAVALLAGCAQIDETERGVVLEFGKYSESFDPGLHFYNVFTKEIVRIPVVTQLETVRIESGSKDLQKVNVEVNVNYHVDPMHVDQVYRQYRTSYVTTILQPRIKETITGITPQYAPEDMLQKREEIRVRMEGALKEKLDSAKSNIIIDGFTITSFSFERDYMKAIEEKQVAEQNAKKELNVLDMVKNRNMQKTENAKTDSTVKTINAKADSIETAIKLEVLKNPRVKELIMLKWIEKWDGKLPQVNSNEKTIPVINMN